MKTAAFHTLGCKVNQYDTQAILELFRAAGYTVVPFDGNADVYVLNTCTVTGTGDKKSLQLLRRLHREHPESSIIACGCLAQRLGDRLLETGARLVIGTQHRLQAVELLERSLAEGHPICAVNELAEGTPFEQLTIRDQEDHSRAILKIQEGCCNRCAYCIIPSVRGPIRSRALPDLLAEANRLAEAGFREVVMTGIHLTSYGRDLKDGTKLIDAIEAVAAIPGIERIRLGSLEPNVADREFARRMRDCGKVCPQFHLALQSGSDSVLRRMRRQYNTAMYRRDVATLREFFPMAAFTTDVMTGFPGETEEEFAETCGFIREIGYARIHVFPYSRREGTEADKMPGQIPKAVKEERTAKLIAIGKETAAAYEAMWLGKETEILPEEKTEDGWTGYTPEYIHVTLPDCPRLQKGEPVKIRLTGSTRDGMTGEIL